MLGLPWYLVNVLHAHLEPTQLIKVITNALLVKIRDVINALEQVLANVLLA